MQLDVLLIHPSTRGVAANAASLAGTEHLGIAYLAAALEQIGVSWKAVDLQDPGTDLADVIEIVRSDAPAVVGLSPTSRSSPQAVSVVAEIRRTRPDTVIGWGGHLASALGESVFSLAPEVDFVVVGEGEALLPHIVQSLAAGRMIAHPSVLVGQRLRSSVRSMPLGSRPRWPELLPARTKSPEFYQSRGARLILSMGCPYSCSFCTTPQFSGRRMTRRLPGHVAEEALLLHTELGVDQLWFNDDVFADGSKSSKECALATVAEIHSAAPSVRYRAMLRADTIARDIDFFESLVSFGLSAVFVGLEAGNHEDLSLYDKKATLDHNRQVVEVVERQGVFLQVGFIMFSPTTTLDRLRANAVFLAELGQLYRFFPVSRSVQIFPGTALWAQTETGTLPYDIARSTSVLRYPAFLDERVRRLSLAFETLEEAFAIADASRYSSRATGDLSKDTAKEMSLEMLNMVLYLIKVAELGASEDEIVALAVDSAQALY